MASNGKLLKCLENLDSTSSENVEFIKLNNSFGANLRTIVGSTNDECSSNYLCTNNNECSGNHSCSGNGCCIEPEQ